VVQSLSQPSASCSRASTHLFWPTESVRRSTIDMRPAGAPGTHRPPLLALVLERSPAGEEARLLLFCAVLLSVVVWGDGRLCASVERQNRAWARMG
jgi:hypothetical protein